MKDYIDNILEFLRQNNVKIDPIPEIEYDNSNDDSIFSETGRYNPKLRKITLFTKNRHIKDILRTFFHEMIHHEQNLCKNKLMISVSGRKISTDNSLKNIESIAYSKGNILFRIWLESLNPK